MHPIEDKVEVSIDFPDKFYRGAFERESRYAAEAEDDGLLIRLERGGDEKRSVSLHLHHYVLAGILRSWAESLEENPIADKEHAKDLKDALKTVEKHLKT
ncbi:MAG: hypothetical protein ACPGRZ_03170 [Alphaproteobacteria bacterium]